LVFLFTIPSAAGLIVLSRPIIGLLFERGRFTPTDTEQTAVALSYYCLGLAGYAAIKVLTPAYYALNDVRIPVLTSVASILVNYTLNWTFIRVLGWGHAGLAFSTSLVATCNFLALFWLMRGKSGGIDGRRLLVTVTKISVASALMAAACWLCYFAIEQQLGESSLARLLIVLTALPLGLLVLYQICRWLQVDELIAARQAIVERLRGPARAEPRGKPYDKIDRNGV
jgi:putative peptidoglycan lipid II flippase